MPKTRISNPVIAPDVLVVWADGLAEDKGIIGLALVTMAVRDGAALLMVLATIKGAELEFDAVDDGIERPEETKDGKGTTSEGLSSAPLPQGILEPSG